MMISSSSSKRCLRFIQSQHVNNNILKSFGSLSLSNPLIHTSNKNNNVRKAIDETNCFYNQNHQINRNDFNSYNTTTIRLVHSKTQIKRLFKQNATRTRIEAQRFGIDRVERKAALIEAIPERRFQPVRTDIKMLPNGWCAPITTIDPDFVFPPYPFSVQRTKNKPCDAVGFLPVYTKHRKDGTKVTTRIRKVSGDVNACVQEIRSVLQIPKPPNPVDDTIRVRVGGTIELDGNRVHEVRKWLYGLGF